MASNRKKYQYLINYQECDKRDQERLRIHSQWHEILFYRFENFLNKKKELLGNDNSDSKSVTSISIFNNL